MYCRRRPNRVLGGLMCIVPMIVLAFCIQVLADSNPVDACKLDAEEGLKVSRDEGQALGANDRGYYSQLRIYVVEPVSSWKASDSKNWYNGFLGFAYDTILTLDYLENFSTTVEWTPDAALPPLNESNIKVIAVMFDKATGHPANSDPYNGTRPFTAYYADAAAEALPGDTGYNDASGPYTHTVFIEEVGSPT